MDNIVRQMSASERLVYSMTQVNVRMAQDKKELIEVDGERGYWVTAENGCHFFISASTGKPVYGLGNESKRTHETFKEYTGKRSLRRSDFEKVSIAGTARLKKCKTTAEIQKVFTDTFKKLRKGFVAREDEEGLYSVKVDSDSMAESLKHFFDAQGNRKSFKEAYKIAMLKMWAVSKLGDVIAKGKRMPQGWSNYHGGKNKETLTLYDTFKDKDGNERSVAVDLRRKDSDKFNRNEHSFVTTGQEETIKTRKGKGSLPNNFKTSVPKGFSYDEKPKVEYILENIRII